MYAISSYQTINRMIIVALMLALTLISSLLPYLFVNQSLLGH